MNIAMKCSIKTKKSLSEMLSKMKIDADKDDDNNNENDDDSYQWFKTLSVCPYRCYWETKWTWSIGSI